jgi:hypothetical protein
MISAVAQVLLSKAITDKDFGSLYSEIGVVLSKKIHNTISNVSFEKCLGDECDAVYNNFNSDNVTDIQKIKCIGLMKVIPYFLVDELLDDRQVKTIIDSLLTKIEERKNNFDSYAHITAAGGCGSYIEMVCTLCEYCTKVQKSTGDDKLGRIDIPHIQAVLREIKGIKTMPARVRFMIEDVL